MAATKAPSEQRSTEAASGAPDERVREVSLFTRLFRRPEFGAIVGTVVVWTIFAVWAGGGFLTLGGAANYLLVAAYLGIVATFVTLLMIGGEFDLSVGSMIGASGMIVALLTAFYGLPLSVAVLVAFGFAVAWGSLNAYIVRKTGLPSFIVTLAGLFALRGLTIAVSRLLTGRTQVGGVSDATEGSPLVALLAGEVGGFDAPILWWIVLVAVATYILLRTRLGNWIFASGGHGTAARNAGVPIYRVKWLLFIGTACAATLVGVLQVVALGSADSLRGELVELEAIAAAVIGGALLTGGFGSAVGAAFGALTLGIVRQGIFFAGIDSDWFRVFLGVLLLAAVVANNWLRRKAMEAR
ncbi:ABC transporter permease [Egibacter rhizosphaerae]|uniref:Xylose transport system permease protein XylH n=1 Tax=Egibacter rhizosphaerae TaxID=1670831 RepID=A0A411YE53_9ACTN|nr:ABC transporter permease [Egibacter rhizosphaerae]QBI19499.1 ABC transporter permease [Egibacter rhizosphaerae]